MLIYSQYIKKDLNVESIPPRGRERKKNNILNQLKLFAGPNSVTLLSWLSLEGFWTLKPALQDQPTISGWFKHTFSTENVGSWKDLI